MAFTGEDLERLLQQIESIAGDQDPKQRKEKVWNTGKSLAQLLRDEFIETDIKIYATYNYDLLQTLSGNRKVDEKHVEKIIRNISKKGYRFQVWQINKEGKVIDMQHRVQALKKIKETEDTALPAFVVVVPSANRDDVVTINSVSMPWKSKHFLESGTNSDEKWTRDAYSRMQGLVDEFSIPADLLVTLVWSSQWLGEEWKDMFKNGDLAFPKEKEAKLRKFLIDVQRLNQKIYGNIKISTRFILACKSLFIQQWFDFKVLQKKFESENPFLEDLLRTNFTSKERIYELFAQAYNYRLKQENRISEDSKKILKAKGMLF